MLLAAVGLPGCVSTSQQDLTAEALQSVTGVTEWGGQDRQASVVTQLNALMDIPQMNALISQAMASNPSLQQSILALKIAYAERGITASDQMPSVDASLSASDDEDGGDTLSSSLTISWELDLWQRLADSSNAADKDIAASIADVQSARDALAATIMRSWLQISLQTQLIAIETEHLALLEDTEQLILEKYRSGLGSLKDLDSAKTNSASTRSTLAEYQEQLAQYQRELNLTLGQFDRGLTYQVSEAFPEVLVPLASLPEQSIANRPDVKKALYTLEAEGLRTSAAYKARLPSISLQASLSGASSSFTDALITNPVWSLLGQLTAPLFDAGKLENQAIKAELTQEVAFWSYQSTLLTAANEVDNALGQEAALAARQQHMRDALTSANRSYQNYRDKYQDGLVDIFDLLSVQESTFTIQSQLTQIQYERLVNRIDLGLALGLGVSK
jgi:NodT family efflux transporter outer membrane factor (OMF) lipoprotein